MKCTALSGVPLKPSRSLLRKIRPFYSSGGERRASTVTCAAESNAAGNASDRRSSANSAACSDLPPSILSMSTVHLHESSGLHDLLEHRWKRYELILHVKISRVSAERFSLHLYFLHVLTLRSVSAAELHFTR